ncbi:MAG: bifunctional hydroxymethylpyrimidine kinase/phosphomethylpyrimidine kinase [Oscillospiraceae bacterium]|nr:bifunctional hydroxymethylpyrimidine kinase/phosphomethylpyrimidine kinase [Oscillospiraceae bacterium]
MGIVVIGTVFVDIKGFPDDVYSPTGRNAGRVETVHGGVGRNVAEDIANVELRPTLVSMVDDTAAGDEVLRKLRKHKVNTDYVVACPDGMGIWLAVFDNTGDLAGSISKRPDMDPLVGLLDEKGDEIFADCDSIVVEIDLDKEIIKRVFRYAEKYNKKVYAVVSNMVIASQRRDFLQSIDCFVCNLQEAGILFVEDFSAMEPEELSEELYTRIVNANIPSMVVTLGSRGSVYAARDGERGFFPPETVKVRDTTGAGDAFCAGVAVGLTYGKSLPEAVRIGTHLAASVITVSESTCPRFLPQELGLDIEVAD